MPAKSVKIPTSPCKPDRQQPTLRPSTSDSVRNLAGHGSNLRYSYTSDIHIYICTLKLEYLYKLYKQHFDEENVYFDLFLCGTKGDKGLPGKPRICRPAIRQSGSLLLVKCQWSLSSCLHFFVFPIHIVADQNSPCVLQFTHLCWSLKCLF